MPSRLVSTPKMSPKMSRRSPPPPAAIPPAVLIPRWSLTFELSGRSSSLMGVASRAGFQGDGVPLQVFQVHELQGVDVRGLQDHRAGDPGFERLLPPGDAHAPPVARL